MDVFSVVLFAALLLGLTAVLGLSYQGVWTQVSGMSTVATAMATELAPVSAVDSMIKLFVNPVNISIRRFWRRSRRQLSLDTRPRRWRRFRHLSTILRWEDFRSTSRATCSSAQRRRAAL